MVKKNMRKKEKFVKILDLSVSQVLLSFINKELLPGTKISKDRFWKGFNKSVHELAKKNKELIDTREKVQKSILKITMDGFDTYNYQHSILFIHQPQFDEAHRENAKKYKTNTIKTGNEILGISQSDGIVGCTYKDINTGWEQSFILSTRHFISVLKDGGKPMLTAKEGRDILKFSSAAEESAKKNKTIELIY